MLALLALVACSSNSDEVGNGNDNHIWHVTLQASLGDATNRALSESGTTISASFAVDDEVKVLKADGSEVCTLTAKTAGTSTTLEGTISGSLSVAEVVTLRYLSATANYDGQVGTLAGIAAKQDYAEGTLTVSALSPLTFSSTSVTLTSKQSITKFSFTDGTNPVNVKTFGIAATGLVQSITAKGTETVGAVTGTLATESSDVYVALRNSLSTQQTYSFYVKDNVGNWYTGTKKANLANGKNYAATVALTKIETVLTSSSAEGTIGVVGGLPAIVVDLGVTIGKKAVALMNVGALCPEHYGNYYNYAEQTSAVPSGWYIPSQEELTALSSKTNAWTPQNGVNGCKFTIGGSTLFLPAAGFYDNEYTIEPETGLEGAGSMGYYWSSTSVSDVLAICYSFSSTNNIISDYKVDDLTVRPFHNL